MEKKNVFEQMIELPYLMPYVDALKAAMELEIFEDLEEEVSAAEIAERHSWNAVNTEYLLKALYAFGFVSKNGALYKNTADASRYMVRKSPEYLAGFTLYYMDAGIEKVDIREAVVKGPEALKKQELEGQMDFEQFGRMFRKAQTGLRQKELVDIVRSLPENNSIQRILDVGCATGMLGLAVMKDGKNRTGVFFDRFPAQIIKESADLVGLADRVEVITGDFLQDDIGGAYDLILGISMMLFAKGNMEMLLKKFHDALNPGGVVLLISEGIELDEAAPQDMYLGYLPYFLQGMNIAVEKGEIEKAGEKAGFQNIETNTKIMCYGTQDVIILRK